VFCILFRPFRFYCSQVVQPPNLLNMSIPGEGYYKLDAYIFIKFAIGQRRYNSVRKLHVECMFLFISDFQK
jgi:hypothetical protein